jgi:hypothetical protein
MIRGANSLNKKNPKAPKRTKSNMNKWSEGHLEYNRSKSKDNRVTLEDYIGIMHGKIPQSQKSSGESFGEYKMSEPPRRGPQIPSLSGTGHSCSKIEPQKYTGTLIKGISTMHKSNAIPVINKQEMIDHAKMRR